MLRELLNRPCLAAFAQPETDGDLLLHFAGWQPYETPMREDLLTSERGQWSLMLLSPWRLDGPTSVICDWKSVGDSSQGQEHPYLVLEGLVVEQVTLRKPGLDLLIEFSGGVRLTTLSDSAGKTDDCWYLLRPDESSIAATHGFQLTYQKPPSDAKE